jgi:hypothetical protein
MAVILDLLAAPAAAPVATCSATITAHPPYAHSKCSTEAEAQKRE